jgi:hypothetical protein
MAKKFEEVAKTRHYEVDTFARRPFEALRKAYDFRVGNNSDNMRRLKEIWEALDELEHNV